MTDDSLHHTAPSGRSSWVFDAPVAACFRDMLERSVPGYFTVQELIASILGGRIADGRYGDNPVILDLGVSTAITFQLLDDYLGKHAPETIQPVYVGVDPSAPMLAKAKTDFPGAIYYEMFAQDFLYNVINPFDAVILSLTLQFIPIEHRQGILRNVVQRLPVGGMVFLFEKCLGADAREEAFFTKVYYDFKASQGYSLASIQDKRRSLENVLVPLTPEWNEALLRREGLRVSRLYSWCNFSLWLGEKTGE